VNLVFLLRIRSGVWTDKSTAIADCQLSAIDAISVVNSPLQQFDLRSAARFNQTVTKIGHTLKPVFLNLKSQGHLKEAKNIAEM